MWGSVGTVTAVRGQKEAFFAATVAAATQNSKSVRLGTTPASLRVAEGWYVGG